MPIKLEGQRVLVIGAGGGIGRAAAEAFSLQCAHVMAAGRPGPWLDATAAWLGHDAISMDLLDPSATESFFAVREPFDHVVMAEGGTSEDQLDKSTLDNARAVMESKFWSAYSVARLANIRDGGSLTLVTGTTSEQPGASSILEQAINSALEKLIRGLALERSPTRVNLVSTGLIDTPPYFAPNGFDRQALLDLASVRLPVRCIGKPKDVAQAILFVATNPYATGSTVTVDGGASLV